MEDCIFCKIVKGEINSAKVWENDKFLSFLTVKPMNPGHTLVIPKKHEDYLFDLSDKEYGELMQESKKLAIILKDKLLPKKIGLAVEGFGVSHVHVHLIPINRGNEMDPNRGQDTSMQELEKVAKKIRS